MTFQAKKSCIQFKFDDILAFERNPLAFCQENESYQYDPNFEFELIHVLVRLANRLFRLGIYRIGKCTYRMTHRL